MLNQLVLSNFESNALLDVPGPCTQVRSKDMWAVEVLCSRDVPRMLEVARERGLSLNDHLLWSERETCYSSKCQTHQASKWKTTTKQEQRLRAVRKYVTGTIVYYGTTAQVTSHMRQLRGTQHQQMQGFAECLQLC